MRPFCPHCHTDKAFMDATNKRSFFIFITGLVLVTGLLFGVWFFLGRAHTLNEPGFPADHKLECVSYTPLIDDETPYDLGDNYQIPLSRFDQDFALLSQRFSCVRLYIMKGYEAVPLLA